MPCYTVKHLHSSDEVKAAHRAVADRIGRMPTMDEVAAELATRTGQHVEHQALGMFLCGDLGPQCSACGDVSDVLCDFPVGDGKTCDRALCSACTEEVAPNVHYCAGHLAEFRKFEASGGVADKLRNLVAFRPTEPRKRRR
jgi:hypothetical protein